MGERRVTSALPFLHRAGLVDFLHGLESQRTQRRRRVQRLCTQACRAVVAYNDHVVEICIGNLQKAQYEDRSRQEIASTKIDKFKSDEESGYL